MKPHWRGAIGKVDPSMKGRSRRPMLAALTRALSDGRAGDRARYLGGCAS